MKNSIEINGVDLRVKMWNGQRVVTFADIDKEEFYYEIRF